METEQVLFYADLGDMTVDGILKRNVERENSAPLFVESNGAQYVNVDTLLALVSAYVKAEQTGVPNAHVMFSYSVTALAQRARQRRLMDIMKQNLGD